ncbi:hypothetical protein [Streptomyces synnematoformans]|uniref:Uncharacterized protein n=1 Tax=Streptomyces synnematoformans TaxID=415721 RepID=A0ABP5J0C1_9ACTN
MPDDATVQQAADAAQVERWHRREQLLVQLSRACRRMEAGDAELLRALINAELADADRAYARSAGLDRLAQVLRDGQQWRDGRLVSEHRLGPDEIRAALGWGPPTPPVEDPDQTPELDCE